MYIYTKDIALLAKFEVILLLMTDPKALSVGTSRLTIST